MIDLRHGDCLELMKSIPDKSIDLICTDIPYELEQHGGGTTAFHRRVVKMRDSVDFMSNGIDYDAVFSEFMRCCKIPNMIIFCSNLQVGKIVNFFNKRKQKTEILVWEKSNPAPLCNGKYVSDLEYIIYVHTKGSPFNNKVSFQEKKKCKIYPIVTNKDKKHPTQKPLPLMETLVKTHSFSGQVVFDPFMGSGSTGVACTNLNRNFIGIELDQNYYQIAKERIEKAEKEKSELLFDFD